MSGQRQRWQEALLWLEQWADGRLLDPEMAGQGLRDRLDVVGAVQALGPLPDEHTRQRLCRVAQLLGQQLQQLDALLAGGPTFPEAALMAAMEEIQTLRLSSALKAGGYCLTVLQDAQLGGQDLYRLTAGVGALVFGSGRRMLQHAVAASAPLAVVVGNLEPQTYLARDVLCGLSSPWAAATLPAVARTAAKPSVLLPWLETASHALEHIAARQGAGEHCPYNLARIASQMNEATTQVLRHAVFRLAENPVQQRQLLDVLLRVADTLLQQIEVASAAASPSRASVLHGEQPAQGSAPAEHLKQWTAVCQTLANIACNELSGGRGIVASTGSGGTLQLLAPAAAALRLLLSPGAEVADTRCSPVCMPALSLIAILVQRAAWHEEADQPQDAATVAALVQLLPLVAAAVRLCTRAAVQSPLDGMLSKALLWAQVILSGLPVLDEVTSAPQAAAWARAAHECLRLLPLHSQWRSMAGAAAVAQWLPGELSLANYADLLANACFKVLPHVTSALKYVSLPRAEIVEAEPLWQLHTTVCRLLHWVAAQQGEELPTAVPELNDWPTLGPHARETLCLVIDALRPRLIQADAKRDVSEAEMLRRQLQGICAAHSQLLPLLVEKLGKSMEQLTVAPAFELFFDTQLVVAVAPATLLTTELLETFMVSMRQGWEAIAHSSDGLWETLHGCVLDAALWPRYAALLLSGGLLAHGLQLAGRVGLPSSTTMAWKLLEAICMICERLQVAGDSELQLCRLSSSTSSGSEPALAAALQAMRAGVQQWRHEGGGLDPAPSLEWLQLYQRTLIPPATQLAQALQAWWAEPEQQAAAQLEAAHAAATRSCAYLRCANLAAAGGPAAGPGQGAKRCGGCRAVWYCGTACSHADWRAGHQRVCQALAAARQAPGQREQQQE